MLGEDAFVSYVQNLEKVQNNIIQNQQKLSQVSKLNRLSPGFRLNPSNIKDSRFKLEGDFHQLTSWDAITKKGQQIYDALDRMGYAEYTATGGRVGAADGLWANIHAKRNRIKAGSGEKMRTPGSKGAPTAKALKESQT